MLVSWERELRPSPDAEALPGDGILRPDWRKCSVRAGEAGPGSLSAACTAAGWESKSPCLPPVERSHMWYSFTTSL